MATTTSVPKYAARVLDADGYTVLKNSYIPMRDGVELCADVFLPTAAFNHGRKVPVICSLGPYGKDVPVMEFGLPKTTIYVDMYKNIKPLGPHASFELLDPLIWVSSGTVSIDSNIFVYLLNTRRKSTGMPC